MPTLLTFLACEKIIVDKNETPTIVVVMQTVKAQLLGAAAQTEVPPEAIAPIGWAIFTIWRCEAGEEGRQFSQKSHIDNGKSIMVQGELPFTMKKGLNFNYVNIFGFPVGQTGEIKLKLWLEADGKIVGEERYYPIQVTHEQGASPEPTETAGV